MNYLSSEFNRSYDLRLNCATHRQFSQNPKGMPRPHHHEDYEIYFLISGNRKYFVQNTIYTLGPNQIAIFKPNVPHQVTVNLNIPYERYLLYVAPQLFSEVFKCTPGLKKVVNRQFFNLSEDKFAEALNIVSKINDEQERNDSYSPFMIRDALSELLTFIDRNDDTSSIIINKSDLRIQNAINFVLEHYAEPITLTDCAEIACMDYFYFSRTFQKVTALSFKEFLNRIRIDKSCELLEKTDKSITEIAQEVGFGSSTHFSITFRAFHDMSPSAYRSRIKSR